MCKNWIASPAKSQRNSPPFVICSWLEPIACPSILRFGGLCIDRLCWPPWELSQERHGNKNNYIYYKSIVKIVVLWKLYLYYHFLMKITNCMPCCPFRRISVPYMYTGFWGFFSNSLTEKGWVVFNCRFAPNIMELNIIYI